MEKVYLDNVWVLLCMGLVFLMQPGFMCLEAGLTRSKNSINTAIKNLTDFVLSLVLFWMFGFAFMYGASYKGLIGVSYFLFDLTHSDSQLVIQFLFQAVFCGTAVTIISGAIAERTRFASFIIITIVMAALIYPIFGHWAWGNEGFLVKIGFSDFAGSTVVHSTGGWVALAALLVIGPRQGRFDKNGGEMSIQASNFPLAMLGTLLLWIGWIGFNGGSAGELNRTVPSIIGNTMLAGSSGFIVALLVGWMKDGYVDVKNALNGSLAGLVAITASCNSVTTTNAIIIGAVGGSMSIIGTLLLDRFKIDDTIGAVPVHLLAGIWGTIAAGLFGELHILGTGLDRFAQLKIQMLGIMTCGLYSFGVSYTVFRIIDRIYPMRVTVEAERKGLNVSEHRARTELVELLMEMEYQQQTQDLDYRVKVEPFTEVGQIAKKYNDVLYSLKMAISKADAIVKHAEEGIITFFKETFKISSLNPYAELLFGYSQDQLLGQDVSVLFSTEMKEYLDDVHYDSVKTGKTSKRMVGQRQDGTYFISAIKVNEIEANEKGLYSVFVRDVTEMERYQCALEEKTKELERSYEALNNFAHTVAHDLRAPLRTMISYSKIIKDAISERVDSLVMENLDRVINNGFKINNMMESILKYSLIGTQNKQKENVDIEASVKEALSLINTSIQEKNASVELKGKFPQLLCNKDLVTQIFLNLIGNSLKYADDTRRPCITIGCEKRDGIDWFYVKDNGIGIKKQYQPKVFQIFSRFHTDEQKYEGSGIGLTNVKKIVEIHGGHIYMESEEGKGSIFYFALQPVKDF